MAAAIYGVEMAIRLGYSYIHLEGDSLAVMQGLTNKTPGCSPFYLLLDRLSSMRSSFMGFRCSFVRRSGNTATHLVARWYSNSVGENVFMSPFPCSLVTLAALDAH
ncbi:unnamed protein product [Amaranthus hypochondriacus]